MKRSNNINFTRSSSTSRFKLILMCNIKFLISILSSYSNPRPFLQLDFHLALLEMTKGKNVIQKEKVVINFDGYNSFKQGTIHISRKHIIHDFCNLQLLEYRNTYLYAN